MTGRQYPVEHLLGPLVGVEVPGGCRHCAAVQTVRRVPGRRRVWALTVRHAEGCEWYQRHAGGPR